MRTINKGVLIVVFLTLIGFLLRLAFSADRFFSYDEAFTAVMAQADIGNIIKGSISAINYPLHFLLLHFWLKAGNTPFFLRISSVIIGSVSIPLFWYTAKKLFNSRVAVLSCFLVTFCPALIFESGNLRMYSLAVLESLLIIYFFWRFLEKDKRLIQLLLGLFLLLGLYTNQYFIIMLLALNLFFFLNYKKNKKIVFGWLAVQLAVLLLFLPVLWLSLTLPSLKLHPFTNSAWKIPGVFVVFNFSWDAIQILNLFPYNPKNLLYIPIFLLTTEMFIFFLIGLKSLKKSPRLLFFLIFIFLPILIIGLVSILFLPVFGVRSFIIFSPAFYLIAALGLSRLRGIKLAFAILFFCTTVSIFLANEYFSFKKTRFLAETYYYVKNNSQTDDIIIHSDPYTWLLARVYLNSQQSALFPSWFSSVTENALGYNLVSEKALNIKNNRFWYFLLEPQYYNRDSAIQKQKEFEEKYQVIVSKRFKDSQVMVTLFK